MAVCACIVVCMCVIASATLQITVMQQDFLVHGKKKKVKDVWIDVDRHIEKDKLRERERE